MFFLHDFMQNGTQFLDAYEVHYTKTKMEVEKLTDDNEGYRVYNYDSAWVIAYALNNTLTGNFHRYTHTYSWAGVVVG